MEYRDIESILAELHGVTPDDRGGAVRSRLRVLRDMGVPAVEKPGKGASVTIKLLVLGEMHLVLLLERFGLPPASVKFVLEDRLGWLRWYAAMRQRETQTPGSPPPDIWVHMRYLS